MLNHRVDDIRGTQELAFQRSPVNVHLHGLRQIALSHGRDGAGNLGGWPKQVFDQRVDRGLHLTPRASRLMKARPLARPAFFTHDLPNPLQLPRDLLVGRDDVIERIRDLPWQPCPGAGQPH